MSSKVVRARSRRKRENSPGGTLGQNGSSPPPSEGASQSDAELMYSLDNLELLKTIGKLFSFKTFDRIFPSHDLALSIQMVILMSEFHIN